MQHTHLVAPPHPSQHALLRALKFLPLIVVGVAVGLIALYEHSVALLVVLALASALALAFSDRVEKAGGIARNATQTAPSDLLGDGGCFPGTVPVAERTASQGVVVVDGGSLEHHRV